MALSDAAPARTFVFVIGCQRSGTTLAGQILGAHPRGVLLDETDGIYPWFDDLDPETAGDLPGLGPVLRRAGAKYSEAEARVRFADPESLAPQVSHIVFKAPNLTYAFARIARLAVPVRIVALVRDPRAVVASMTKLAHIPMVENQMRRIEADPDLCARFHRELADLRRPDTGQHIKRAIIWRIKSGMGADFSALDLPCHRVRYEDLVACKTETVAALQRATGLPPSDRMLAHHQVYRGTGPGGTRRTRGVDASSLHLWQDVLDAAQGAAVMTAAGALAQQLGYGAGAGDDRN